MLPRSLGVSVVFGLLAACQSPNPFVMSWYLVEPDECESPLSRPQIFVAMINRSDHPHEVEQIVINDNRTFLMNGASVMASGEMMVIPFDTAMKWSGSKQLADATTSIAHERRIVEFQVRSEGTSPARSDETRLFTHASVYDIPARFKVKLKDEPLPRKNDEVRGLAPTYLAQSWTPGTTPRPCPESRTPRQ